MIDYSCRYSKKAKYLQLKISSSGVEVIIPSSAKIQPQIIEQFITQRIGWIKKHLDKFKNDSPQTIELPKTIHLHALNEIWCVNYVKVSQAIITLHVNSNMELTLMTKNLNHSNCFKKLRQWLMIKAEEYLIPELYKVASEVGLPYNKVSIRNNSSRWGSCSKERNINLCCKLLFISPILVRHILLHELCHTRIMSHDKKFWKMLSELDPHAQSHAKQLKLAAKAVPSWV